MGFPQGHEALAYTEPVAMASATEPAKTRGHGRGKSLPADKTDIGLRGVPVIGHGSGAISGSAPGGELGAAARLERAGRDIVRAHRNRFKAKEQA